MFPSLRSLLSQWFFGSSGLEERKPSTIERLAIFTLLLILFYGGVWLLFWRIDPFYGKALTVGTQLFYALEGKNLKFFIEASEIVFRSYARPAFEARLSAEGTYSNSAFLLTLILVTPGMRLKRRSIYLAIGAAILYLTHVGFLLTKVEMSLIGSHHPLAGQAFFWEWSDNFFEIMGKASFQCVSGCSSPFATCWEL